jgi:VWFA-related protein
MTSRHRAAIVFVSVAACAVLAAEPQQPPVFRAGTTLVEVDAIVKDRSGRFVADLGPGDFEVLEDGKPQAIEGFYLVRGTDVTPVVPGSTAPVAAAPAPKPAALPRVQRVFVLVFDLEHVSAGGVDRAKKAALGFLDANFRAGDVGGIVSGGSMVNGRLTSDVKELSAAIGGVKPTGSDRTRLLERREWPRILDDLEAYQIDRGDREALARGVTRACADDPDACRRGPVNEALREKARRVVTEARAAGMRSMRTLAGLSNGLARVPGRKTVVLLSDGFFAEEEWGFLRQVTDLAARGSTRFYALDTRGLNRGSGGSDILDAGPRAAVNPAADVPAQDFVADAPNGLAVDTGGLAIRNENDFGKALNEIADDTSNYYVLALRPATLDGKFRPISVRVKREGMSVRARKGYMADARPTAPVPAAATPAPLEAKPVPAPLIVEAPGSIPSVRLRADVGDQVKALEGAGRPPLDAYPADLARRARAGLEAYQRGDVAAARERLRPAADHPQAPGSVRYVLGWSHYALGEYAPAVEQWEAVRASTPAFEPVYLDLADGYVQQREFGKAVAALRDAAKRWPKDVEVYNALGVVLAARGAADDAIATFEQGVAVGPDDETANYNLAKTLELRFVRRQRERGTSSSLNAASVAMDRERALEYYRRVASVKGSLAERAEEGIKRLTGK